MTSSANLTITVDDESRWVVIKQGDTGSICLPFDSLELNYPHPDRGVNTHVFFPVIDNQRL